MLQKTRCASMHGLGLPYNTQSAEPIALPPRQCLVVCAVRASCQLCLCGCPSARIVLPELAGSPTDYTCRARLGKPPSRNEPFAANLPASISQRSCHWRSLASGQYAWRSRAESFAQIQWFATPSDTGGAHRCKPQKRVECATLNCGLVGGMTQRGTPDKSDWELHLTISNAQP